MIELLSPAGNFEKMKTAFLYGADAVYLAFNRFGMRAAADNFTLEELNEAIGYARALGKPSIPCRESMNILRSENF